MSQEQRLRRPWSESSVQFVHSNLEMVPPNRKQDNYVKRRNESETKTLEKDISHEQE